MDLELTQKQLAEMLGVSRQTIIGYETGRVLPRTRKAYAKIAEVLGVKAEYLLNDNESFILAAGEEFGPRGRKGAEKLVNELTGLFAGGEMTEEDMDAMMFAIQEAYVIAKRNNKKYTPKKYQENGTGDKNS